MTNMSDENIVRNSKKDPYHSFLESLKGKEVTIFRGGPESKSGILLDVQSDFVTVYAQNNNNNNNNNDNNNDNKNNNNNQNNAQNNNQNQNVVVYYNTRHIASISENSVTNSTLNLQELQGTTETETPEFVQSDSFTGIAGQLEGKYIQINQGGPEAKTGQVLGNVEDYIVLFTEDDGVVYFNVHHIKSIHEYSQNNQNQNNENNNNAQTVLPEFENVDSFQDLFGRMSHKWIAINRGGPEAMEGILVENSGGHYTLINNQEVMRINPYHIKSISSGPKGALKQNNQNNNQQQNNQQQQNTEATAQSQGNENKSQEKNKSERGSSRRSSKEKVVKTIDYVWKSK